MGGAWKHAPFLIQRGNITAILDEKENVVVKYDYDAWGNHRVLNSAGAVITDTQHIGHKNPFRYRGYYYDTETGLYYLKSRYYDPETCRFINMDSVEYADPTYLHGLNLYAYCNNNPIMYVDPNGHAFLTFLIAGLVVGAIAGFGATVYADYKDDGAVFNGSVSAGAYVGNTLVGGAIGGIIGGTIGALPTIASGLGSAFAPMGSFATVSGGAIAITGEQALLGSLGLIALGNIVFAKTWKSGGYRIKYYPDDHNPAHVHIFGDDIGDKAHGIRIGMDGNPLPGQGKLPLGAKKALKKLWKLILGALSK